MSNSVNKIMIQPSTKKVKLNDDSESENADRLSNLPDCVIIHILSLLNTKHAVQTSVLSSRWNHLWKRIPALILHSSDFSTYQIFTIFVSRVLSLRDSSIALHTLDFKRRNRRFEPNIERIVSYAISHNVQRIGLSVNGHIADILPSTFSSQTLTHLKLSIYNGGRRHETLFPKSLNLPSLTNLQLGDFAFGVDGNGRAEPFSTFNRLNSLLISNCIVRGAYTLCISSVTLVNLTMYNDIYNFYIIDLCTPSLCKFVFTGTPYHGLSLGSSVSSLKHVDIDAEVISYLKEPPLILFCWLQMFSNIKSLTVSTTTLQVLSLIPDPLKVNHRFLCNLKSLKVILEPISYEFRMTMCEFKLQKVKSKVEAAKLRIEYEKGLKPSSPIPDGIVDFLLQNAPSAEAGFIDYKRLPCRGRNL